MYSGFPEGIVAASVHAAASDAVATVAIRSTRRFMIVSTEVRDAAAYCKQGQAENRPHFSM
jgi:hypothetical protein